MSLILPVRHFKQQSNWDCGVTCLKMLADFYYHDLKKFEDILRTYQCNQSTWTIDLLYLVHQMNIQAKFSTITIGCSTMYEDVPYYERLIDQDRQRVDKLFKQERDNIHLQAIEWNQLKNHLIQYRKPCLVLIDANKLQCCTCRKSTLNWLIDQILPDNSESYQGHYVLLIGFTRNEQTELVRYTDPSKNDGFCTATRENFDLARKAFGTDEDIIFCFDKNQ